MTILDTIMEHKRETVARQRTEQPLARLRALAEAGAAPVDFVAALRAAPTRPALIAEIKRRSPSRGPLAPDIDPTRLALTYRANGASCISILTDERFFGGSLDDLRRVRRAEPGMPLLCKDFLFDPYQLYQARAAGADAVLLIVAALEPSQLRDLQALASSLGMAALIETHTETELATALACEPALLGINSRDLHSFTVDLTRAEQLVLALPAHICVVAESGIHGPADLVRLTAIPRPGRKSGVDAVLVGEALLTAADPGALARILSGTPPCDVEGEAT